jgi:very-short-patch-repair endonuclease
MRGPEPNQVKRARALRHNSTKAELMVWRYLRDRQVEGFKFVRQQPIGPYYVDFVCRQQRVVVEIDGGQHADSASDRVRDAYLVARGYRVIRIWNNDALQNMAGVFEFLASELHILAPTADHSLSPLAGRGLG